MPEKTRRSRTAPRRAARRGRPRRAVAGRAPRPRPARAAGPRARRARRRRAGAAASSRSGSHSRLPARHRVTLARRSRDARELEPSPRTAAEAARVETELREVVEHEPGRRVAARGRGERVRRRQRAAPGSGSAGPSTGGGARSRCRARALRDGFEPALELEPRRAARREADLEVVARRSRAAARLPGGAGGRGSLRRARRCGTCAAPSGRLVLAPDRPAHDQEHVSPARGQDPCALRSRRPSPWRSPASGTARARAHLGLGHQDRLRAERAQPLGLGRGLGSGIRRARDAGPRAGRAAPAS